MAWNLLLMFAIKASGTIPPWINSKLDWYDSQPGLIYSALKTRDMFENSEGSIKPFAFFFSYVHICRYRYLKLDGIVVSNIMSQWFSYQNLIRRLWLIDIDKNSVMRLETCQVNLRRIRIYVAKNSRYFISRCVAWSEPTKMFDSNRFRENLSWRK